MKHSGPISGLAATGAMLVTSGYDGAVALYSAERQRYVGMHRDHRDLVTAVAAAGDIVFSGDAENRLIAATATKEGQLLPAAELTFTDAVESLAAFGDAVIAGLGDGTVHRVVKDGERLVPTKLADLSGTITAVKIWGDSVVLTCNDGSIRLLSGPQLDELTTLHQATMPMKNALVLELEGQVLAGGHDRRLVEIDPVTHGCLLVHEFPSSVRGMAATAGSVYVGCYDGVVYRFERDGLRYAGPASLGAPPSEVWTRHLTTSPDGTVYVAGMNGFPITVDGVGALRIMSNVNTLAPSAGGAVVGADDGSLFALDCAEDRPLAASRIGAVQGCVTSTVVSPGGSVACCTWSGAVYIDGEEIARRPEPLLGIAWLEDDLAVGTYDGEVIRFRTDGTEVESVRALPSSTKRLVLHGSALFVVGRYGPATVIDVGKWVVAATIPIDARVSDAVAVSPDGASVAIAAGTNQVWVFEIAKLSNESAPVHRLAGHTKPPKDIVWLDDDVVVTTGYDGLVIRHALADGSSSTVEMSHTSEGGNCGLLAIDDRTVVVAGFDGVIEAVTFDVS